MKILFNDLVRFRERSGVGGYAEELVSALAYRSGLELISQTAWGQPIARLMKQSLGEGRAAQTSLLKKALKTFGHQALDRILSSATRLSQPDLSHEPDLIPSARARRVIVTAHDLSVLRFPEWHPPHRVEYHRLHTGQLRSQVDRFIANSTQTKTDLIELLGIPSDHIDVVLLAPRRSLLAAAEFALPPLALPDRYFLYTGTIEPRKNIPGLLEAYRSLPGTFRKNTPLILVGGAGWGLDTLVEDLRNGSHKGVRYLGYRPDHELAGILSGAAAFLYPSFFEGFGLPPLEAMALGVPVIASERGSLKEVLGSAAVIIDPDNPQQLAQAMIKMIEDPSHRQSHSDAGRIWAATFSWERTAEQTWESYGKALK
ncbi:MAG: glycosyltransferase family 4 protein [Deltaproteobacteria bacterium]|nr:glycosyltransferase family 4 protein [Deltaproteobacteria bacterium]